MRRRSIISTKRNSDAEQLAEIQKNTNSTRRRRRQQRNVTRRCRRAEPDAADQAQMSPIGSRPRSPYPTARDRRARKAAAILTGKRSYGNYRAPNRPFIPQPSRVVT